MRQAYPVLCAFRGTGARQKGLSLSYMSLIMNCSHSRSDPISFLRCLLLFFSRFLAPWFSCTFLVRNTLRGATWSLTMTLGRRFSAHHTVYSSELGLVSFACFSFAMGVRFSPIFSPDSVVKDGISVYPGIPGLFSSANLDDNADQRDPNNSLSPSVSEGAKDLWEQQDRAFSQQCKVV